MQYWYAIAHNHQEFSWTHAQTVRRGVGGKNMSTILWGFRHESHRADRLRAECAWRKGMRTKAYVAKRVVSEYRSAILVGVPHTEQGILIKLPSENPSVVQMVQNRSSLSHVYALAVTSICTMEGFARRKGSR